jgi:hypothetical protein
VVILSNVDESQLPWVPPLVDRIAALWSGGL